MNLKLNPFVFFMAIASMTMLASCEKDDDSYSTPVISDLELGTDDSHIAYPGEELHIESTIVAEGFINTIEVEIHAEDGSDNEIDSIYDYSDQTLKNTTFHEHIEIPSELSTGDYHFHLTVTDKEGYSTTIEEELTIEELIAE